MADIDKAAIAFSIAIVAIGVGVAFSLGVAQDAAPLVSTPSVSTMEPKTQADPFADLAEKVKQEAPKDDYSISEVFERPQDVFLWDSNLYKQILSKLKQMNPKAVVWTFYFPESLFTLIEDPKLKDLARQRHTIWSSRFDGEGNFLRPPLVLSPTGNSGVSIA